MRRSSAIQWHWNRYARGPLAQHVHRSAELPTPLYCGRLLETESREIPAILERARDGASARSGSEPGPLPYPPEAMTSARDMDPPSDRDQIVRGIARMLSEWAAIQETTLRKRIEADLADISDASLRESVARMASTGGHWGYHPPDTVARRCSRAVHAIVLESSSALIGAEVLEIARARPVILLANHLSFVDANVADALISHASYEDVANRLTVVVGPKVFSEPIRRLASLCFGTIKIPQSASRASGEAVMSLREVARLASGTLEAVRTRQSKGDHLLIFVEGSRSRSAEMQSALTAVARYVEHPDALLIPLAVWGTEKLMPVSEDRVHAADVTVRLGRPVEASALRELCPRRAILAQAIGFLIADLLPPGYRGHYGRLDETLAAARAAATAVGHA